MSANFAAAVLNVLLFVTNELACHTNY